MSKNLNKEELKEIIQKFINTDRSDISDSLYYRGYKISQNFGWSGNRNWNQLVFSNNITTREHFFLNINYYTNHKNIQCLVYPENKAFETKTESLSEEAISNIIEILDINIDRINNLYNKISNDLEVKNIILYGAPGVGKTHNYKNLISMIEEGKSQNEIFDVVSKNQHVDLKNDVFESIKKEGRVEFVTFHQSYSYEDFIEGFRPNENGDIKLEDGIFKNIVNNSLGKININDIFSISRKVESDRSSYIIESVTNDLINIKKERDDKVVPIPKKLFIELLKNLKNGIISLDDIKNRNLERLETNFDKYMYGYNSILYTLCKNVVETIEYKEEKNFYIVIDEINRGNISKIFGELITLIEEDKRDIYEVTLPYSKEKFKVPSNLYIIATMNSTDKSIATIDIALRRRFTFLKMKPNEDLILHVKAKELFNALNVFIKNNLNEDYMLGHSYFMKIENDDDLAFVKEYKIKPLLEEYFYADDKNLKEIVDILDKETTDEQK